MNKIKEIIRQKLLRFLGIVDWRGDNLIVNLEEIVGNRYIKFVRYGEYLGEKGHILDRLLELEKKVYKKETKK